MNRRAQRAHAVLAIETATEACSAAVLAPDGRVCLRCTLTERSHAELVLPMVDEVLHESGLALADLDGLAFGRGPGGFTGLRIAAGVIQGLAYATGLPVAPVSSLAAVAWLCEFGNSSEVVARSAGEGILVCNDARMGELYWGTFRVEDGAVIALGPERVSRPADVLPTPGVTHFAGNGLERHPELRRRLEDTGLRFREGIHPRADAVVRIGADMLARGEGVAASAALPTYVRDDVARPAGGPGVTGMS